jgi:hypothetical protein
MNNMEYFEKDLIFSITDIKLRIEKHNVTYGRTYPEFKNYLEGIEEGLRRTLVQYRLYKK